MGCCNDAFLPHWIRVGASCKTVNYLEGEHIVIGPKIHNANPSTRFLSAYRLLANLIRRTWKKLFFCVAKGVTITFFGDN